MSAVLKNKRIIILRKKTKNKCSKVVFFIVERYKISELHNK